jgi:heptosyltransferase-1
MKVLIVKVSALGDVVHALPVLAWLKSADPGLEIDWLVEEGFAPLLEGHPLLRKIIRLDTRGWRKQGMFEAVRGSLGVIRQLRREHYDVVLDLQGNSKSGVFTRLCGAPMRFGFAKDSVREWPNLLATNRKVTLLEGNHHISDRSLAIARKAFPAGSKSSAAGPLTIDGKARSVVEKQLNERGLAGKTLIVLHYGTTWKTKLWPLDLWCELAGKLCDLEGCQPILTWGNEEERIAVTSIHEASGKRAEIWPRGSLMELAALLERADLVVGGDTGPIHIAAAVGTPTVSLFRVTDATRNGPRGEKHIWLQSPLDCSPCLRKECERNAECGRSLTLQQVFEAAKILLKKATT